MAIERERNLHQPESSGEPIERVLPSRRSLLAYLSAAAAMGFLFEDQARAAARPRMAGAGDDLPIVIIADEFAITIDQVGADEISVSVASIHDPNTPIYSSTHTGMLTDDLVSQIEHIGTIDLRPGDVRQFNAILRRHGLEQLPTGGGMSGAGGDASVTILVLFILLVIIGAGFG